MTLSFDPPHLARAIPRPVPAQSEKATLATSAAWEQLPRITLDASRMRRHRLGWGTKVDEMRLAYDMLRTRLVAGMRTNDWRILAVASPTRGCGATSAAINLAFSCARHPGLRTGLIDLDLRKPSMVRRLGISGAHDMEALLNGETAPGDHFVRLSDNLMAGLASHSSERSAELLNMPQTRTCLDAIVRQYRLDLLICDLPPMLGYDNVLSVLPNVDASLLVAGAGRTTLGEVDACERELSGNSNFLGVVLSQCRHGPNRYGY